MLYGYDLIQIEEARKLNKKKIVIAVIIAILVIALAIGLAILIVSLNNQNIENEDEIIEQIDEQEKLRIEEENRIKEEKRKEQERIDNIRTSEKFTNEQIQAIENIYDDVGEKRVFLTF